MMPARRAACSGSPFLTAPAAHERAAPARDMRDRPARDRLARGHRLVADVDHLDAAARVDVRERGRLRRPTAGFHAFVVIAARGQEERQALERDRQIHALQLHVGRHLQRARRKIQDRLDARGDDEVDDVLGRGGRARR